MGLTRRLLLPVALFSIAIATYHVSRQIDVHDQIPPSLFADWREVAGARRVVSISTDLIAVDGKAVAARLVRQRSLPLSDTVKVVIDYKDPVPAGWPRELAFVPAADHLLIDQILATPYNRSNRDEAK